MNARDHVERRDDGPRLSFHQAEEAHYAQLEADAAAAYEHHINAACAAIQRTPFDLVTPAFIGQVLSTLACKAIEAKLPEIGEDLDALSCEVTP